MTKEEFCGIMKIIVDSYEKNLQFAEDMYNTFSKHKDISFINKYNFEDIFRDNSLSERLVEYLEKIFDCECVSWWIYEMDCGKNPYAKWIDELGNEHTVYNIEELWNMINFIKN